MKLSRLGEFGLIEQIRRKLPAGDGVRLGIGDDAAWIDHPAGTSLVTADMLIEGVDFDLRWTSFENLGFKSLAVNLSDIAAMGGVPAYAVVSLGLPVRLESKRVVDFYRGMNALARPNRITVVGGDLSASAAVIVSVCVIGHAPAAPVRRAGASAGDEIYVTGTLGDSALGLKLLKGRIRRRSRTAAAYLLARHHRPTPRLEFGALLARYRCATAMIDVSDGLLQDLRQICSASGIGAVIDLAQLPLSPAYRAMARQSRKAAFADALTGGEDYELLFCASPRDRFRIDQISRKTQVPVAHLGRCVRQRGVVVVDRGKPLSISRAGHDHFRQAPV